jgi:anti-sigma B factor antagonist
MAELGTGPGARLAYEVTEDRDGCPLVRLRGELDMTTAPSLESAVAALIASSPPRLVIDASGLDFADSSAIALLVRWANLVREVEIRQPPELLRRVIARMGLSDRLRVSS